MTGITHIAGLRLEIDTLIRQRCDWCGALLVDVDLTRVAFATDDPTKTVSTWPPGAQVHVDGPATWVEEGTKLVATSCAKLDPAITALSGAARIDIKEFREHGYLQEVNRQFLHPLGLALEVHVASDGSETLGGVWDYRDDPEGIRFEGVGLGERAATVAQEWAAREQPRTAALGYMIQPVGPAMAWRYAAGSADMIHTGCGGDVYALEDGVICSKCKQQEGNS